MEPSIADKSPAAQTPKVIIKILHPFIVAQSGFDSVADFVVYVLRDMAASAAHDPEAPLSQDELDSVRRPLRSLGYLP